MKYTLGSSAPLFIFHNLHKTLNNLYVYVALYRKYSNCWTGQRMSRDIGKIR